MICNLDGSWTLEPEDIRGLNLAVGKILQERAESNIKSFNANKFVKYMHDQILDKTNDAQKALAFARFVPEAMLTLSVTKPDIRRALTAKGFDIGQVTQLSDRFSNSLNDVANFIAEQTPSSNTSNINGQIQTNTYISNLQPKPEDAKEPILANKGDVSDLPYSPLSTTGNELIEGREWYYGFIKKLGDIITKTGISSDGVVSYNGVETDDNNGGIRLAFVKGNSIPVNQLYPDNQNIAEIESIKENQYFAVITDSKGNYLYFTDNYEATNADQGKLVYFPVRTVPSFKVNERGIRVYNLEEQMDKSIQSIEDRIRKSPGVLTREQVIEEYSAAYDLITDMKLYLEKNPNEKLFLNITGYDKGTINYDPDATAPLSVIDDTHTLSLTGGEKYVTFSRTGASVPFSMQPYSSDMANNVANLLTGDVLGTDGKLLTPKQKYEIIRDFTILGGDNIGINPITGEIYLKGETLDPKGPETKNKIIESLTRTIQGKNKKGQAVEFKNQYSFDSMLYKKPNATVDMFSLEQTGDGKYNYISNPVNYKNWVADNAYVKVKLDENGRVRNLNGYIKYEANIEAFKKINPAKSFEGAPSIVKKQTEPSISNLGFGYSNNFSQEVIDAIKAKIDPSKLYSMRDDSVKATAKQIKDGKNWYDNLEITFKDQKGKQVTKKLSEVVPYEVLFKYSNSNPKIRAQFTKSGITLFKGSDSTALYHEAWHAFTQLFMTPEERKVIYNEVKKLNKKIRYYNHNTASWETMMSGDLDFSKRQHILYAEEFLADEFREYAKTQKNESSKLRSFFKKLWEAIKALFGKAGSNSLAQHHTESDILNSAFNELYTGNFVDRTYNQENTEFDVLYSGITLNVKEDGTEQHMNVDASLAISEAVHSNVSYITDAFVNGLRGEPGSKYTLNMLINPELKKVALQYAYDEFVATRDNLQQRYESTPNDIEKQTIAKRLAYIQEAIDNFGDLENLDNNKDTGVIAYYNKRTGFLDFNSSSISEDQLSVIEGTSENAEDGDPVKNQLESNDGTQKSAYARLDTALKYIMSSIYKRVPISENNPDGYVYNMLGARELADPRTIFTLVSSSVEGANSLQELYNRLKQASDKKDKTGTLMPNALMLQQFLFKLGNPNDNNNRNSQSAHSLWIKLYHSTRYDRLPGRRMIVKQNDKGSVNVRVGVGDSGSAALKRDFEKAWQLYNPSPFASKDAEGNTRIKVSKLKDKYQGKNYTDINPIEFFRDLGIKLTDTEENIQNIKDSKIIDGILQFRLEDKLFKSNIEYLTSYSGGDSSVVRDQTSKFNKLYDLESRVNPLYSNYMARTAEEKPRSERSNPSAAGNVILDLNNAASFNDVINQPHLAHFNTTVNPNVKTSLIFKRMFGNNGDGLGVRRNYNGTTASIEFNMLDGSQYLSLEEQLIKGISSANSDKQTAWLRDFFFTNLYGVTEAYRHADKSASYIAKLIGPSDVTYYIKPSLFVQNRREDGMSEGRQAANDIIIDYIGAELERIKKVKASKNAVSGEKASDVILYMKDGKYVTLEDTGSTFTIFDGILTEKTKNYLINSDVNTVEEFRALVKSDPRLKNALENQLNTYFNNEIEKDTKALRYYGLSEKSGLLTNVKSKFIYKGTDGKDVYPTLENLFPAAVENFVYTSFIHRIEMNTLIYGDPAIYHHNKDEHMKRVPAFFATGKIPVTGELTQNMISNNAGRYAESDWFKNTGLPAPEKGALEGDILSTAVLEDAFEDSVYFDTMVNYAAKMAMRKNKFASEELAKKFYSKKYSDYKNMKSADAQAWITFDAYRALEMRFDNWGPEKEALYNSILNGKEPSADQLSIFFPIKKLQYAGAISSKNFALNAFHKYSVMPLIPTVIKGTKLEKLHNKMVSQGVAYSVMHTGSKLVSLGKNGQLDLFYKQRNGSAEPAFTDPNYTFTKNDIFLNYLKEQLVTHDTWHNKQKFPTQARKLITSGVLEQGFPVDFETGKTDIERVRLWNAIKDENVKRSVSPAYDLERRYQKSISKMIDIAEDELKKELGYTEGKINIQKLIKFIKESLAKKQVSLYEIDYLKIGSDGKIQLPADLASDPSKIEKLIVSLVNKRVVDQLIYGEAYIQGSGVGFEKYTKPTEKDLENHGTNDLLFYRPVDKDGNVTDDPDKAVAIRPMQVKVALQGDFVKMLELEGPDGKKIETIDRLNTAIKNQEWLDKNDHRKMITLGGTRIPTASMNYIDTMEIAEFLPGSAGNILILPSEIVAKSGADYDIDKMIIIRPVISNNRGVIELTRPKATTRTLEEIAAEKKNIKDYISTIYDDYNEYIDEARKQRLSFTSEQKEEFNAIRNKYRNPINALRKELNAAYDKFISDPNATNASYQETEDSLQSQIDKLTEEESALKKEFLKRVFGENFLNETLDRRNKELEEENEKLRELNRESNSFKARAYQNEILDNWSELILRKDNYTALTIPNSTDLFTDKETGIVKDFRPINRKQEVISSPTKIMQNTYNIDKAIAMASGKMGIGMLATGATFFNLYKSVGLSMNPDSTVYNTAGTKSWIVKNVLRTKHNGYKTEMGQDVISLSHALDANVENDIAEVVSQIMNGYLDVAKDDWVFDINATKEFESEVEFLVLAGVPLKTAAALVSQPMVREYLEKVQRYNGIFPLATGEISNPNFAKYQATVDILSDYRPDMAIGINKKGEPVNRPTGEILSLAQEFLDEGEYFFELDKLMQRAKKGEVKDDYDLAAFLHFLEIQNMAKGNVELKRNLNFDTNQQQSLFEANQKEANLLRLSDKFSRESINKLINETVLHNFKVSDLMRDAVSAILPLRGVKSVNKHLSEVIQDKFMDKDKRERYQDDFVNDLTLFMFYNYHNTFEVKDGVYNSATISTEGAAIQEEPLLRAEAFYNPATGKLSVDNNTIDFNFRTKAFSKPDYRYANLPIDIFAGYPEEKQNEMYRHFVYERALLRESIPYENIDYNFEFQYFSMQRMNDGFIKDYNKNQLYEEFIRNKALDKTLNVNALFKTNRILGIYSIADRFINLLSNNPQLIESGEYDVLKTLSVKDEGGYRFLSQKFREKDPDQLTAYVIQMMKLMDPAEVIANREGEKQVIAEFFSMLPLVGFMQAGNNVNSRISMGAIFDQTRTGLPEMLLPSLNSFINDLNSPKSSEILSKYTELFNQKQPSVDEKRYIPGAVFVNYSSSMANQIEALTPSIGLTDAKNVFIVNPIKGRPDNKAVVKSKIATKFIGFAEGIPGSSTGSYAKQAGAVANTGNYSPTDVVFVSVPGKRGSEKLQKENQDKTIAEAIKAVEAGATILTDNKAYTDSNTYNTGEKRLYEAMEKAGYNYSEITVDGQLIGTWNKGNKPATENVYSQLGDKTESPNLVISNIKTKDGKYDRAANIKEAQDNNRVYSMETDSDLSFSNPWAHFKRGDTIKTATTKEAVQNYIDWLTTDKFKDVKPERREWILNQLKSGSLKGKTIQYYAELNEPSHATALDYLINKYDWSKGITQPTAQSGVKEESTDLLKSQKVIKNYLDVVNGTIEPAPKVYDESMFVQNGIYALSKDKIAQIGAENPGKLFVFDDYFLTSTGVSMDNIDRTNSRQAWIAGKPMGISFGIPTLSAGVASSIPVTDQNYEALKAQIDAALDNLLDKRNQGYAITFPSRGIGQSFVGYDLQPTKNVRLNDRPAPSLFVYLSKRLLEDFGYVNPVISDTESGLEYVQSYFKSMGEQTVTDKEVMEYIKKCKGL